MEIAGTVRKMRRNCLAIGVVLLAQGVCWAAEPQGNDCLASYQNKVGRTLWHLRPIQTDWLQVLANGTVFACHGLFPFPGSQKNFLKSPAPVRISLPSGEGRGVRQLRLLAGLENFQPDVSDFFW